MCQGDSSVFTSKMLIMLCLPKWLPRKQFYAVNHLRVISF